WNFGDGTAPVTGATPTHAFADNGTYTVTLRVSDGTGASDVDTLTVQVSNVAPTIESLTAPPRAVRGAPIAFAAAFSDPGTADTHQVSWDFGDGTVIDLHPTTDAGALAPTHTYAANGSYVVTVTVRDDDGGVAAATSTVRVMSVELLPDPHDPTRTD